MTTLALVRMPAARVARQVIAHHSKSFALASKLLPAAARDDATILYAWCRHVDDAVDHGNDPLVVARLEGELEGAYGGFAHDPIVSAFGEVARRRTIPRVYTDALLVGMEMDLDGTRYATVDELITYAYCVAGVVGLMMTHVLGISDDDALVPAAHLGIAMQLTNVCRDVVEDWERGRLYLPDELLARHGAPDLHASLGGPLPRAALPAVSATVRDLLALADRYYASADRGLSALPWRASFAIRSARGIYAAIGDELARVDHDVTAGRAVVQTRQKLAKVARAAFATVASLPRRIARRRRIAAPTRILELMDVPRL